MTAWTRRLDGQKVWLIGASSGIGAEVAKELVRSGARVAISARRADRLEEVSAGTMAVIPVDAADPQAITAGWAAADKALGGIDTVIWCAAYWHQTDAAAWDTADFVRHVELNLLGFNALLGAIIPTMVKNRHGHIVGIASVAGYRGFPGGEAYGATKAAQISLLEALRGSLRPHGIRVTTVAPGFVRTELTAVNKFPMPFLIDADTAGKTIVRGLRQGKVEIVFPLRMAIVMKIVRLLPIRWWAALTSRG